MTDNLGPGSALAYEQSGSCRRISFNFRRKGPTPVDDGDVESVFSRATKLVEAEYQLSHQAHAPMEPPNCTALVTDQRAELWFGTQAPDVATRVTANLTGLAPENVFVHNCFSGGGFGRGGLHGEFQQAVIVAKALAGRPVKLLWSREQDISHDNGFHPMGVAKLTAALDVNGLPEAIWVRIAGNDEQEGAPLIEYGPHKAKVAHRLLRGFHLLPYATRNLRVEVNTMKISHPARRVALYGQLCERVLSGKLH